MLAWMDGAPDSLDMIADVQGPAAGIRFGVSIEGDGGDVEVLNDAGGQTNIGTVGGSMLSTTPLYFLIKWTFDIATERYIDVRINDTLLDASAVTPFSLATLPLGRIDWTIRNTGEGSLGELSIDDVVFTYDEP